VIAGNYVYIAGGDALSGGGNATLWVIDISNPLAPVEAGVYSWPEGMISDVAVADGRLYLASGAGLRLMTLANPAVPAEIGFYALERMLIVSAANDKVYGAGPSAPMQVIDLSEPTAPVEAGTYPTSAYIREIEPVETYVYLADGYSDDQGVLVYNLFLLDFTHPTSPSQLDLVTFPSRIGGLAAAKGYTYLAGSSAGLYVLGW
jgi:hypothetical protein